MRFIMEILEWSYVVDSEEMIGVPIGTKVEFHLIDEPVEEVDIIDGETIKLETYVVGLRGVVESYDGDTAICGNVEYMYEPIPLSEWEAMNNTGVSA